MDQKPSIGRIVHYKTYGTPNAEYVSQPVAAMITGVNEDSIDLVAFYDNGVSFKKAVNQGDREGQWSWPPRV